MENNQKKILVIEDDLLMIKILKFILKKEGYQVSTSKDGLDAIQRIPIIMPDLIITDIMMPFKSGLEVISFVKENHMGTPVIVVSSLGEEQGTVIEAFKLGVDDFVPKPFNPNELLLRVKRLLAKTTRELKIVDKSA